MRKLFYIIIGLVGIAFLLSCDSSSSLARNIQGTWVAQGPVQLTCANADRCLATNTYTFSRATANDLNGDLTIYSVVSINYPVNTPADPQSPVVDLDVAATVSASGTWSAVNGSELTVIIDPRSVVVTVDPDAVNHTITTLSGDTSPEMQQLTEQFVQTATTQLRQAWEETFVNTRHITHISFSDSDHTLSWQFPTATTLMRDGQ